MSTAPMQKSKLPTKAKFYIVKELAAFRSPTEIAAEVKELFGVEVTDSAISHYNPATRMGSGLRGPLREAFDQARKEYLAGVDQVAVSSARYRQEVRDLVLKRQLAKNKPPARLILEITEAAAREVGGSWTNRHAVDLTSGGERFGVLLAPAPMSREEWEAAHGAQHSAAPAANGAGRGSGGRRWERLRWLSRRHHDSESRCLGWLRLRNPP